MSGDCQQSLQAFATITEWDRHTQKVVRLMILTQASNLNTLQAVIHRAFPLLDLESRIGAIRKYEWIPRVFLHGLRVIIFRLIVLAIAEGGVALVLQGVGKVRHVSTVWRKEKRTIILINKSQRSCSKRLTVCHGAYPDCESVRETTGSRLQWLCNKPGMRDCTSVSDCFWKRPLILGGLNKQATKKYAINGDYMPHVSGYK